MDTEKITSLGQLWAVTVKATLGTVRLKTSPQIVRKLRKRFVWVFGLAFMVWALMDPSGAGNAVGQTLVWGLFVSPLYVVYRIGRKRGARHKKSA